MERSYLVVEGPHDVEFVGRLLKLSGFSRANRVIEVEEFWRPLIPTSWPVRGDLSKRLVEVPSFFRLNDHTVAVQGVGGNSRIAPAVEETLTLTGGATSFSAIGVFVDADSVPPGTRFKEARTALSRHLPGLPVLPGTVSLGPHRSGVFVFPDNQNEGALDDLLLDCAGTFAPKLFSDAGSFVAGIHHKAPELSAHDMSHFEKPNGRKKATVGCIATVFRPGKSVPVSIHDNEWVSTQTLALPRINAVNVFLRTLLDL
jgi:hypothetical protein